MFQLLSTDLFDDEVNWSYVDGSDAGLTISRGSCDFPEEVYICGETNLIADGYHSKHADGNYQRLYDESQNQFYFKFDEGNELNTKYLWYFPSGYHWIVSKEVFKPDTAVMYRHKESLLGSDWFVLGNGAFETCHPDSTTCGWLFTDQKISVSESDCPELFISCPNIIYTNCDPDNAWANCWKMEGVWTIVEGLK